MLGYFTMAIALVLLFLGLYMILGVEGSYQPGSYEVSMTWAVLSVMISFGCAVLGGIVCAKYTDSKKAVLALAVLVLILGVLSVMMTAGNVPTDSTRPPDVDVMEAMTNAQSPAWANYSNPIIGILGTWLGGWLVLRKRTAS